MEDHSAWAEQILENALIDGKVEYFLQNYDFNSNPSQDILDRDEIIIGKEMIDECWNQWLAYNENLTPAVFDGDSFHGMIDDLPPSRLLELFQDYFKGWLEGYHSSDES